MFISFMSIKEHEHIVRIENIRTIELTNDSGSRVGFVCFNDRISDIKIYPGEYERLKKILTKP